MKRSLPFSLAALAALTLGSLGFGLEAAPGPGAAPASHPAPPAVGDWTRTIVATPEGGFRMGNPAAPVKLVEYGSLTCSHCAEFSKEAAAPLRAYVSSGRVSWEFRSYMIFPTDPAVSLLLGCRGPETFFELTDQLYAEQAVWADRLMALPDGEAMRLLEMETHARLAALVRATGLDEFFEARGMTRAQIDSCLLDKSALVRLAEVSQRASRKGVVGTPTFFINGRKVENAVGWKKLEVSLRSAAASRS